jgi:hypothetical protein
MLLLSAITDTDGYRHGRRIVVDADSAYVIDEKGPYVPELRRVAHIGRA